MDFQPVERASQAFQRSLTVEEIGKVCRRAFGAAAVPVSAGELGTGMYNNVYRVTLADQARPVNLRVAPQESRALPPPSVRAARHPPPGPRGAGAGVAPAISCTRAVAPDTANAVSSASALPRPATRPHRSVTVLKERNSAPLHPHSATYRA